MQKQAQPPEVRGAGSAAHGVKTAGERSMCPLRCSDFRHVFEAFTQRFWQPATMPKRNCGQWTG